MRNYRDLIDKILKEAHQAHFSRGEGTMRNSLGEIDNLVQCQIFVLNLHL